MHVPDYPNGRMGLARLRGPSPCGADRRDSHTMLVIAPFSAPWASLAYFANTPLV